MAQLQVNVETRGEAVIVTPRGEIAYEEAATFRGAMKKAAESRPKRLVVDLSAVEYMNTPGVAVLVEALQMARRGGTRLVLCSIGQRVKAILQIAKLTTVFEIKETLDAALAP